ncbi:MAG: N-acetylneuraminate synthase family protein [Proteobacteria bacterium]|nr:N-acetylneuraminate synthase family protein [Pseudomonadota bacterium]
MTIIRIADQLIGKDQPAYFIADIAANHDGSISRAKDLISLVKEAGGDAVKFQNFRASKIVSEKGFKLMEGQVSHQNKWQKSVYEVYEDASIPFDWSEELHAYCRDIGIHYFSTPYDFEAVDMLEQYVLAYKIGSGDITWLEMLERIALKAKPVLLATGASAIEEVKRAVATILSINPQLVLMQCNTNYTASAKNFRYINLRVLNLYHKIYPELILGLSDHTLGHATVLGAVALGAKVIEKHFTDDISRKGPDHAFSMTPATWKTMVEGTRELEAALGNEEKKIEDNEQNTVIIQRRCIRAAQDIPMGTVLEKHMLDVLRPAPGDGILPYDLQKVLGRHLVKSLGVGDQLNWEMLGDPK